MFGAGIPPIEGTGGFASGIGLGIELALDADRFIVFVFAEGGAIPLFIPMDGAGAGVVFAPEIRL